MKHDGRPKARKTIWVLIFFENETSRDELSYLPLALLLSAEPMCLLHLTVPRPNPLSEQWRGNFN